MEQELLSSVPMVWTEQEHFQSSSPDAAVTSASPLPPDDFQQSQDLLRRIVGELHIPLQEVQDK